MTKIERKLLKKGMEGSIEKQSKMFNQSFVTKYLYKQAVKRGQGIKL